MVENIDIIIQSFDRQGDWIEFQPGDLKKELIDAIGANFEIDTKSHESLKKVTNIGSLYGVVGVVGNDFYEDYKSFCEQWTRNFESDMSHRNLPKMVNVDPKSERKASGSKTVGMRHYLHYLVSYAAGDMDYNKVKEYMEVMDRNGHLWQERSFDNERTKIEFNGKNIKIGSIPPGFAKDAWNFIKNYKK